MRILLKRKERARVPRLSGPAADISKEDKA